MQRDTVIIKTNAYGLTLILDPDIPFEQLLADTGKKFSEAARFFKNARMALTFRGRELTGEQEIALIRTMTENASINIVCLVDEDKEHGARSLLAIEEAQAGNRDLLMQVYHGTLTNGMKLEAERSLLILGDVNPGASVVSTGNVIILGCCMGQVSAGIGGDEKCFVAALTLLPSMLRIAGVCARSAITKHEDTGEYPIDPKLVYLKEGHLVFEPLKSAGFEHLRSLGEKKGGEE